MDISADFAASGAPASLLTSVRGSARLRARDGRIGGVRTLSGVSRSSKKSASDCRSAELESDPRRDAPTPRSRSTRGSLGEKRFIDRALLESGALNIAMQGEIGLGDRQVALTGIALPIVNVNALLRRVPIVGRMVGDPIVGIPFSVSGDIADPKVSRVGAGGDRRARS